MRSASAAWPMSTPLAAPVVPLERRTKALPGGGSGSPAALSPRRASAQRDGARAASDGGSASHSTSSTRRKLLGLGLGELMIDRDVHRAQAHGAEAPPPARRRHQWRAGPRAGGADPLRARSARRARVHRLAQRAPAQALAAIHHRVITRAFAAMASPERIGDAGAGRRSVGGIARARHRSAWSGPRSSQARPGCARAPPAPRGCPPHRPGARQVPVTRRALAASGLTGMPLADAPGPGRSVRACAPRPRGCHGGRVAGRSRTPRCPECSSRGQAAQHSPRCVVANSSASVSAPAASALVALAQASMVWAKRLAADRGHRAFDRRARGSRLGLGRDVDRDLPVPLCRRAERLERERCVAADRRLHGCERSAPARRRRVESADARQCAAGAPLARRSCRQREPAGERTRAAGDR